MHTAQCLKRQKADLAAQVEQLLHRVQSLKGGVADFGSPAAGAAASTATGLLKTRGCSKLTWHQIQVFPCMHHARTLTDAVATKWHNERWFTAAIHHVFPAVCRYSY